MNEYKQIIVPIALFIFGAIILILLLGLLFNYLNRRLALQAIKQAMSNNQTINPVLIEAIISVKSEQADYRKSWLFGVVAVALLILSLFIFVIGHKSISMALLGIAFLPGLLSVTYKMFYSKSKKSID